MMTIKRSCSYRIITRAVDAEDTPLVGMLTPGAEDYEPCVDRVQLQAALDTRADAIIVYNQHADALALVDTLSVTESQVFIEIRQDTRDVPGLHALRRRSSQDETLELIYQ